MTTATDVYVQHLESEIRRLREQLKAADWLEEACRVGDWLFCLDDDDNEVFKTDRERILAALAAYRNAKEDGKNSK